MAEPILWIQCKKDFFAGIRAMSSIDNNVYCFYISENVRFGEQEERLLITGLHTVIDIHCISCGIIVGWKYASI